MSSTRKEVIPAWYIHGNLDKTLSVIFDLMKKRKRDDEIAKHFNVPVTTIKGFLSKKVKQQVTEFRKTLEIDHPRAVNRCIRSRWLINDSRKETTSFIVKKIVDGHSKTEIAEMFTEMSGVKVTNAMVNSYIANHMNVNFTQAKIDEKLNQENRFFSVHIIGSKPEALDKLMGVA